MKPNGYQIIAEFTNCDIAPLTNAEYLTTIIKSAIDEAGAQLVNMISHTFDPTGITAIAIISESHIAVHTYPEARQASIDVFTCSSLEKSERVLNALRGRLNPNKAKVMTVMRGNPMEVIEKDWMPSFSNHGFETSYHVQKILYSGRSKYQQIDIIENEIFGKMLFLDRDLQIAERDAHIYNHYMTNRVIAKREAGQCDRVAILGGGDGGILKHLIEAGIPEVFLVDIDVEVINKSRTYLREINNGYFEHPNTALVVEDANVFLRESKGECFDAVVYDLTMHPEALTNGDRKDFLNDIFGNIKETLKPNGIIQMQCCSEFDSDTLKILKNILRKHFLFMDFQPILIPSFCEKWVFATATKNMPKPYASS